MNLHKSARSRPMFAAAPTVATDARRVVVRGVLAGLFQIVALAGAFAQPPSAASAAEVWRVATKESPPFAFQGETGEWSGISVELAEAIATRMGVSIEWQPFNSVEELVAAVEVGQADAAISAISVTSAREKRVDFSHPYFLTGLGVAVRVATEGGSVTGLLRGVTSRAFLQLVGLVALLVIGAGIVFFVVERRRNPQYQNATRGEAISTGMWWSLVILFGHKGIFPRSWVGAVLAATGMLASVLLLSVFTGAIASILTVSQLDSSIGSLDDLRDVRVVTVTETSSERFLTRLRVFHRTVATLRDGMNEVRDGDADAVVYDAPLLEYLTRSEYPKLHVLDQRFDEQEYAIAFGLNSRWRKPVNQALLELRSTEALAKIVFRYLGR